MADYSTERRRVVNWYNDSRWVAYCGYCGVRLGACHCGTTPAGASAPARCPTCTEVLTLCRCPKAVEDAPKPATYTRMGVEICAVCNFPAEYCRGH